jgi:hypothetical protein
VVNETFLSLYDRSDYQPHASEYLVPKEGLLGAEDRGDFIFEPNLSPLMRLCSGVTLVLGSGM